MSICFNPRAHVGRDLRHALRTKFAWFQSTRPRGARLDGKVEFSEIFKFQSTRPRGARPRLSTITSHTTPRFNPRAHVGRDLRFEEAEAPNTVSIHAPTWGATAAEVPLLNSQQVSIHAPTWGATVDFVFSTLVSVFQSTRPRGARLSDNQQQREYESFNPRSRVGRDVGDLKVKNRNAEFQSTRPRGARPCQLRLPDIGHCFNPRARVGRDRQMVRQSATHRFQSTRPRGARQAKHFFSQAASTVSIHAPAWGATSVEPPH